MDIKMNHTAFTFGEEVEGFAAPVLNEREIRAAAGLMFLALFTSFVLIQFRQDFLPVKYVVLIFLADFLLRVVASPRFSPLLILGRVVVSGQVPEYVGAAPKRFAWKIGLGLSGLMFALLVVLNSYSIVTTISCFACLLFLFFEAAFGICLGCVAYGWFFKKQAMHCAGELCGERKKEAIQQVSNVQILVACGFVLFLAVVMLVFRHQLAADPQKLSEIIRSY